jgi:hypothetical protein
LILPDYSGEFETLVSSGPRDSWEACRVITKTLPMIHRVHSLFKIAPIICALFLLVECQYQGTITKFKISTASESWYGYTNFSAGNPNGVWSYGYSTFFGGPFNYYLSLHLDTIVPNLLARSAPGSVTPLVGFALDTEIYKTLMVPKGTGSFHPGTNCWFAIIYCRSKWGVEYCPFYCTCIWCVLGNWRCVGIGFTSHNDDCPHSTFLWGGSFQSTN